MNNNLIINLRHIVIDCKDAKSLANFYATFLSWDVNDTDPEWISVSAKNSNIKLLFQENEDYISPIWPDEKDKQQKSIHLDFSVSNVEDAVIFAISLGAKKADVQFSNEWTGMIDPEGHPFCLF